MASWHPDHPPHWRLNLRERDELKLRRQAAAGNPYAARVLAIVDENRELDEKGASNVPTR